MARFLVFDQLQWRRESFVAQDTQVPIHDESSFRNRFLSLVVFAHVHVLILRMIEVIVRQVLNDLVVSTSRPEKVSHEWILTEKMFDRCHVIGLIVVLHLLSYEQFVLIDIFQRPVDAVAHVVRHLLADGEELLTIAI